MMRAPMNIIYLSDHMLQTCVDMFIGILADMVEWYTQRSQKPSKSEFESQCRYNCERDGIGIRAWLRPKIFRVRVSALVLNSENVETGRHTRLKILGFGIRVRVPVLANIKRFIENYKKNEICGLK